MAKVDKKKVGFAVFLMVTMVLSTIGFIYTGNVSQDVKAEEFRGYEMASNGGVWQVKLDEENALTFYEDPRVLEKLPYVPINKVDGKVYVAFTPGNDTGIVDQAMQRLDSILRYKGVIPQRSCFGEAGCAEDVPIVDCEGGRSVVYIKVDNETNMFKDGSCVVMQGDKAGLDRLLDRVVIEEVLV